MSPTEEIREERQAGWVVLANQVPRLGGATPELAANLVERIDLSRPPVILTYSEPAPAGLAELIDDLSGLLGVKPVLLPAAAEPPAELAEQSMIVLAGGQPEDWVGLLSESPLGDLLLEALLQGAVILASGAAAASLGSWYLPDSANNPDFGVGWVAGAIILPGEEEPSENEIVRTLLEEETKGYALALAGHTLVALGPDGDIQVWGQAEPVIMLGPGWSSE